jgi:hypothetical protein
VKREQRGTIIEMEEIIISTNLKTNRDPTPMHKHGNKWNPLCEDRGGVKPTPVSKTETKPTRDMLWFSLRFGHLITDKGDPNGRNI